MANKVITEFIMKTAGDQNQDQEEEEEYQDDEDEMPMETDTCANIEVEKFLKKFLINSESSGLMDSIDLRLMLIAMFEKVHRSNID
jgi:hypothetical protein